MIDPDMEAVTKSVAFIEDAVVDLDERLEKWDGDGLTLPEALEARSILNTTSEGFRKIRERLDDLIGDAMGEYRVVVEGHGQIERHRKKSRAKWDKDLLRAVLDSQLIDGETGEVLDPTPLDKVLHVWNLGTPRTTALKARGIDPDEWCETEERPGWTLRQF